MKQYHGKDVTSVRDAEKNDTGYDKTKDQVVITLENGEKKTVLRTDVTEK